MLCHKVVPCLAWPFLDTWVTFPKSPGNGKEKQLLFTLFVAFWTLIPGAAYQGWEEGPSICFMHLGPRGGDGAPDLGITLISPAVKSGGLGEEEMWKENVTEKVFLLFVSRILVLKPQSSGRRVPNFLALLGRPT